MTEELLSIPTHVGFIIDGNRRFALKHGLPGYEGHLAGYSALKDVAVAAVDKGISYVSFYVFSTENWQRSKEEVKYLMKLIMKVFTDDADEFMKNNIRVRVLGSREGVEQKVLDAIDNIEARTANNTRGTIAACFNYGGRREIVDAVKAVIASGATPDEITEEKIASHLYCPDVPNIDMMVRTSGEKRISNFMLWRVAYAELMFLEKMWPETQPADVDDIIAEYNNRHRRFGGN